jgi:hypothetical protein
MAKILTNNTSLTVYGWAKQVKLKEIYSLEWLLACKLNYLQALARRINKDNDGEVFCSATLGSSISKTRKYKLASAIWEFLNLKRSSPRCAYSEIDECGNQRIITETPVTSASAWTVNIGFNTATINGKFTTAKEQARVWQNFLHSKGYCSASVIRTAKRCKGFKYELKVWLLNEEVLKALISKENKKIELERKAEISNWYEQLILLAEQHNLSVNQPDFLFQSARLTKTNALIGAVGVSLEGGYYYNTRPSSAVSRNMQTNTLAEAVEKLVSNYNARMNAAIARL